jgi:SAM-dependent methyltransferase
MVRAGLVEREEKALAFGGDLRGKTVIDLGCGVGRLALRVASLGGIVHGYDVSGAALNVASENARALGVADRCFFHEVDLLEADYPQADIWYDLGCLQYIPDIAPVLRRLTHIRRFYSSLPRRGRWQNIPRWIYRSWIKRTPYRTYTEREIRELFAAWGEVRVEARGLAFSITSAD